MKYANYPQILGKEMISRSVKTAVAPDVFRRHIARQLTGSSKERYDIIAGDIAKLHSRMTVFRIVCFFAIMPAIFLLLAFVESLEVGLSTAFANAPYLFYTLGALTVAGGVLIAVFTIRRKKMNTLLMEYCQQNDQTIENLLGELDLPSESIEIDLFQTFFHPVKGILKGRIAVVRDMLYYDDAAVYYLDSGVLIRIPKSELIGCEAVEEKVMFNSIVPDIDSKEYRAYGIKKSNNNAGQYVCKTYGMFLFNDGKETFAFEVLINSYEQLKTIFGR